MPSAIEAHSFLFKLVFNHIQSKKQTGSFCAIIFIRICSQAIYMRTVQMISFVLILRKSRLFLVTVFVFRAATLMNYTLNLEQKWRWFVNIDKKKTV